MDLRLCHDRLSPAAPAEHPGLCPVDYSSNALTFVSRSSIEVKLTRFRTLRRGSSARSRSVRGTRRVAKYHPTGWVAEGRRPARPALQSDRLTHQDEAESLPPRARKSAGPAARLVDIWVLDSKIPLHSMWVGGVVRQAYSGVMQAMTASEDDISTGRVGLLERQATRPRKLFGQGFSPRKPRV